MTRLKTSNPELKDMIILLEKTSKKNNAKVYKSVAKRLSSTNQNRAAVGLWKLNKVCKDGETIIVPGKVLGYGVFDKKVIVAAWEFSKSASDKLGKEGISINELIKKNPSGKGVKIIA